MTTSWSALGGTLTTPVTLASVQTKINAITTTDPYFPDFATVGRQYYQTVSDRFLAQGGSYPVTTFWNPWCTGTCTTTPYEALPALPSGGTGESHEGDTYCILATHADYPTLSYSFSSDILRPGAGNCDS